jgi:SAM-dependent methyltransferase
MCRDQRLAKIPRGCTQLGVNHAIVEYLLALGDDLSNKWILDIPCGQGELVSVMRGFFPRGNFRGGDLRKPGQLSVEEFAVVDARRPFSLFPGNQFDLILSVSGVLEFDNTLQFFESIRNHLADTGIFIVTDDNIVSVRDRLEYLFLGKFRHPYDIFVAKDAQSWKAMPIHNLLRNLLDAGFDVRDIRYIPVRPKDWFLLPLALLILPIQALYVRYRRSKVPLSLRRKMYPFRSLLSRHYFIVCAPGTNGSM